MSNDTLQILQPLALLCGGAAIGIVTSEIIKSRVVSFLTALFCGVVYVITMSVLFDIAERIH